MRTDIRTTIHQMRGAGEHFHIACLLAGGAEDGIERSSKINFETYDTAGQTEIVVLLFVFIFSCFDVVFVNTEQGATGASTPSLSP